MHTHCKKLHFQIFLLYFPLGLEQKWIMLVVSKIIPVSQGKLMIGWCSVNNRDSRRFQVVPCKFIRQFDSEIQQWKIIPLSRTWGKKWTLKVGYVLDLFHKNLHKEPLIYNNTVCPCWGWYLNIIKCGYSIILNICYWKVLIDTFGTTAVMSNYFNLSLIKWGNNLIYLH